MIEEYPIEKRLELLPLFENHNYLRLLLEGLLREGIGTLHVNNKEKPTVAMAGRKIIYFLAGDSSDPSVPELLEQIESQRLIFIPDNKWLQKLKEYWGKKLKPYTRTKFSSNKLDINHMKEIQKKLPDELIIEHLTKESIENISKQAKNVVKLTFPSLEKFIERNFGFCILDGEKISSLALAASPIYDKHFEIHIETDPEYQRKGLAMISCAKLIEYSLQQGLVPHWDADNEPSAKLALKLGFTEPEKYHAYFWFEK
ncbi:MAG: GNAT family N-acetyltransferase [Candidatus Heimdallarchaeota archaeon]|nr:GNAT family N-acetyltransferase [Candidatus Heimdallarchaeota archaeon]MBY8994166.1 GNAT family N-acetyltransferase [Candidatus Heimdallarchaeota archaeon]